MALTGLKRKDPSWGFLASRRGAHRVGGSGTLGSRKKKEFPRHLPTKRICQAESSLRSPSFGAAEPLPIELWMPLDQSDRKATTFITSHFYLDDFVQSSEDPNPQPVQHTPTPLTPIPEEGFRTPAEATDEDLARMRQGGGNRFAFRSQLPQDAAKYVRLNVLSRLGPQPQPPPQIIGRPDDVERLLDEAGQLAQEVERGAAQAIEELWPQRRERSPSPRRAWAEPSGTWGAWQSRDSNRCIMLRRVLVPSRSRSPRAEKERGRKGRRAVRAVVLPARHQNPWKNRLVLLPLPPSSLFSLCASVSAPYPGSWGISALSIQNSARSFGTSRSSQPKLACNMFGV